MRYGILGGDMRFAHLVQMLRESGRHAVGFLQEQAGGDALKLERLHGCDCIISNWPMKWPLSTQQTDADEILSYIAPGSVLLLCGPGFPEKRRWDLQYVNLWQDERLLQENAWLTAEGAAASVLQRDGLRMPGLHVLVVGCGRIGRALTEILSGMGAQVTVVTGSEEKCACIQSGGAQAVLHRDLLKALPHQRLIFSTPPSRVLGRRELEHAAKDAVIVDLASPPYGVDLEAAGDLGLHARREPGLPGRHSPLSAARALHNAIISWEEEQAYD